MTATEDRRPEVGDEVEYAPGRRAVVGDIRSTGLVLLHPIRVFRDFPAPNPDALRVTRTRAQVKADGDL